jgi:hypothetical protein
MEELIILSDLWGKKKIDCLNYYSMILKDHFKLTFFDSRELAAIDSKDYSEEELHQQFVNGGINQAVTTLLQDVKETTHILGFSIGGYIAWKAVLEGLKASKMTLISSTRLRYENNRPSTVIDLYYGEKDIYRPTLDWFKKLGLNQNIYRGEEYNFYRKQKNSNRYM